MLALYPNSAHTITWVTSGAGGACSSSVVAITPPHSLSSIENFVTQWKSARTVSMGSAWNSSYVQLQSSPLSNAPKTRRSQVSGRNFGSGP